MAGNLARTDGSSMTVTSIDQDLRSSIKVQPQTEMVKKYTTRERAVSHVGTINSQYEPSNLNTEQDLLVQSRDGEKSKRKTESMLVKTNRETITLAN